jgi:hypothetical protein
LTRMAASLPLAPRAGPPKARKRAPRRGPDPAVTAQAAGNVLATAQAAGEAGKALAAGDLDAVLAGWPPAG